MFWIDDYKESLVKGKNDGNEQYDENPCLGWEVVHQKNKKWCKNV